MIHEVPGLDIDLHLPEGFEDVDIDETDPDDEQLAETPADVVAVLGLDPLDLFTEEELELAFNSRQPRDQRGRFARTGAGVGPSLRETSPGYFSGVPGLTKGNQAKMTAINDENSSVIKVPLALKPTQVAAVQKAFPGKTIERVNANKLMKSTPKAKITSFTGTTAEQREKAFIDMGISPANSRKLSLLNTTDGATIKVPLALKPEQVKAIEAQFGKKAERVNANKALKAKPPAPAPAPAPAPKGKPTKSTKAGAVNKSIDTATNTILSKTNNKYEMAIALDENGKAIAYAVGNKSSVPVYNMPGINTPPPKLTVVHNHPNNSSFSTADLQCSAYYKGMKEIVAVGSDGSVYRGRTLVPLTTVTKAHKKAQKKSKEVLTSMGMANSKHSWKEGWAIATHLNSAVLAKAGMIEYTAKLGSTYKNAAAKHPKIEAALKQALGL